MYHTLLCTFLITFFTVVILAREEYERTVPFRFVAARSAPEGKSTDAEPRVIYWIPARCDSMAERGYTCKSCEQAMHCMLGNTALLGVCYGLRPYCNNGVCSDVPSQRCRQQYEQQQQQQEQQQQQLQQQLQQQPQQQPQQQVTQEVQEVQEVQAVQAEQVVQGLEVIEPRT